jgi:hypothetical protein
MLMVTAFRPAYSRAYIRSLFLACWGVVALTGRESIIKKVTGNRLLARACGRVSFRWADGEYAR